MTATKEFKLRLPVNLAEEFYRKFPGHGERQTVLRKIISALVEKSTDRVFHEAILDVLHDGD